MGETITQIGRYEISRQLVDTALASVYDAFDPVERKPVAIRVPRTTQTHNTGALAVGLKHPGLMTVLSYGENKGEPFLVLEPFAGQSLDTRIPVGQKMEPAEALALLRQLASALDYAHTHGSIHGSLDPSAILVNDRGEVKVLDLGPVDLAGRNASAEQLLRAVHYLSPECIRDRHMDGRSDQFSLAVLAHRMLTGELPFRGTPLGVMFRIAYQGLERDAIRHLPPPAQTVFQRSLAKLPAERYSTCTEMVDKLQNVLVRVPVAPTRLADASLFAAMEPPPAPPVQAPVPSRLSHPAIKYFGVTFVVVAAILAALFLLVLPKAPKPASLPVPQQIVTPENATPVAPARPASPPSTPAAQSVPPDDQAVQAKPKTHAAKKKEPELELKPVEPKIIHP